MNICINFYGQQRDMNNVIDMLKNYIRDRERERDDNKFYILYTGWENEEPLFETLITDCYVKRVAVNKEKIEYYVNKYSDIELDITNVINNKNIEHIMYGFYIKQQSINTINEFMEKNNIQFDLIVTLRIDTKIIEETLFSNYEYIQKCGFHNVYVSKESMYDWNILNVGAISDFMSVSNYENTVKILNQLDNLEHSAIYYDNKLLFHPESSFCKYLRYNNFNILRLNCVTCRSY